MSITVRGYAAQSPTSPLAPFTFERREPGEHDVQIDILYSGICHSDLHQTRDDWTGALYPMVPGHEIVGRVSAVGAKVSGFKVGDYAGVGCMVDPVASAPPASARSNNTVPRVPPGPITPRSAAANG